MFSSVNVNIEELVGSLQNNPSIISLDLSFKKINDQNIEALVQALGNITHLELNGNNISCNGARTLAQSQIPRKLTYLDLSGNNIGFEGIRALVGSPTLHKTFINLSTDSVNSKDVEALAQSQYSRCQIPQVRKPERNFTINDICDKFYDQLIEAYFRNQNISNKDKNSIKEIIFDVITKDNNGILFKHILKQPDKYPFLINLQKDEQGYGLSHFYHSPEMQEFLFKHGLVPEKEQEEQDNALQNVANSNKSTHYKVAVNQTNFITTQLVEDVKADKDELKQAATSYMENISKLLKQYQDNQMKVMLLSLTENEKRSVMEKTLPEDGGVPDDKEFIEIVSNKVERVLEQEYLRKNQGGEYITQRSITPLQYDYARGDAKVTIPESIGYIKLLIDRFPIPIIERKELLVTLANRNPELVQQKLSKIREELGNNNISQEQIGNKTEFHELLNNVDDKKVNKLFEEISGLNIEETWREQKEFVLLKQIYVAATTYGENSNACTQGTWSQIINSVSEIDLEMINQYAQHLNREKDQERQRDGITEKNVIPFVEDLAGKLIQYVQDNPGLKGALEDFALVMVNIEDPEGITLEHQKILAAINQGFTENIKEFLPNYGRNIPKQDEYKIIIEKLPEVGVIQNFVNKAGINNNQGAEKSLQTEFQDGEEIGDRSLQEEKSKEPLTVVQKEAQPNKKMTTPPTTGNLPNEVLTFNLTAPSDDIRDQIQEENVNTQTKSTNSKTYVISIVCGMGIGTVIAYLAVAATLTPIGAVAVFIVAAVVGALLGYGIGKFCEKVSEEKQNDPDMSTWTAVKSVLCGVF